MSGREFDDLEIEKADLNNDAPKQDQEDQTLPQGAAQPQESHASQQGESQERVQEEGQNENEDEDNANLQDRDVGVDDKGANAKSEDVEGDFL